MDARPGFIAHAHVFIDHLLDCHSSSLFLNPTLSSDGLIDLLQQLHLSVLCNFSKLYTY